MDRICRAASQFGELVIFQNIKNFYQRDAAGGGWGSAEDFVAAIVAVNGLTFFCFVGGHVIGSDQSTTLLHGGCNLFG